MERTRPARGWFALAALALAVAGCSAATSVPPVTSATPAPTSAEATSPTTSSTSSPASSPAPSPSPRPPASCVEEVLAGLSPAERAGQVLMVGAMQPDAGELAPVVRRYHLGGAFLAGRWRITPPALAHRTRQLQAAAGVPLLIAVDQEGGRVQGLSGAGWATVPSALEQGGWTAPELHRQARRWAGQLVRTGVRMNLAPVADVVPAGSAADNPPIGAIDRQYGGDPAAVAADVTVAVGAFQGAGVLATVKHFPGLGRVRANTDTGTGAVDRVATGHDPNLAPFRAAAGARVAAVMISSARYPKLDARNLAAFSPAIVTGLLRGQLGYDGLVISDDLGQARAVARYPVGERAVRFLSAGGDLVLTVRTADAGPMVRALLAKAASSAAFRARLDAAARRVLTAKDRIGLLRC